MKLPPLRNTENEGEYSDQIIKTCGKTNIISVSELSDDYDPNGINKKKSGGSFNFITFTILGEIENNGENNTFLLALSSNNTKHKPVSRLIYEDIN